MFKKISIIAPGLLGASIGKRIKVSSCSSSVVVWARRAEARAECLKADWCTEAHSSLEQSVEGADLIIICAPVNVIPDMLRRISGHVQSEAIITDVGSVKAEICEAGNEFFSSGATFLGSHPMAGSEKGGMEHADADLFEGKLCFVTPLNSKEEAVSKLASFWHQMGMCVQFATPEEHDQIVAAVSHLPHFLASSLAAFLSTQPDCWPKYSGNGLRDTTRVASGGVRLWSAIFKSNREALVESLQAFRVILQDLEESLKNEDYIKLEELLEDGKKFRDSL